MADQQWSQARRLAAPVRSILQDAPNLPSWKNQLQIALTFMLERDTTAALAIVHDIERGGCGRPAQFGNEIPLVTYPAMARVLAGDTAGAIRGLEAAFAAKPWPTREALRYHPILGPVLGFPRPTAP
jgi:hypothetical protein